MPIDEWKLKRLLERVRDASHRTITPSAKDLFAYIDGLAPQSGFYRALELDRANKWAKWAPRGMHQWDLPDAHDERLSLTWDLYRSVGEQGNGGNGLLVGMYGGNFDSNVSAFNGDFFDYLVEAIETIVNAEPSLKPKVEGEREKHQKFGILDAPRLLETDMMLPAGILGRAAIFLDLDSFKAINERFSERVVDQSFLPNVQRLVARVVDGNGFAYAEGGDEMVVLLPNASRAMSLSLASELRTRLAALSIDISGATISVTASLGVAWQPDGGGTGLADCANLAKKHAKQSGKNCVSLYSPEGSMVVDPSAPSPHAVAPNV